MEENGPDRLEQYRFMRHFDRTPEPSGGETGTGEPDVPTSAGQDASDRPRFVVQEHHATALHWDFRLERDGVLVSWAVPKGIPPDPSQNHLAVHTEDHPMSYIDFEGQIPEEEYGGGKVMIWDRGTYTTEKWSDREVMVTLQGERVRGRYVLFQTGGKNWMMHRMDPSEDPDREPMPVDLRPMDVPQGDLPADPEAWSFEAVWGGERALVASQGGRIRVDDRSGDVTGRYPDLRQLGRALGAVAVVLEGELMVAGPDGRADPARLRERAGVRSDSALRRLAERAPVTFLAADVLWLEGHSTTALPYTQRRRLLDQLALEGPTWRTVPSHPGEGPALLRAGRDQGLAGVMARRLDAGYEQRALLFVAAT